MQRKLKSVIDKILALLALIILCPIMIIAAIGIKLSDKGPIFYKAKRMGKDAYPIVIYKFRTMKVGADKKGAITGVNDSRIFKWGELLRKTKIDELPQLFNILRGTMSIVGPRPEDVKIVKLYYTGKEMGTLDVLPGLACPGSIFNYTHGDRYLSGSNTDDIYVKKFLHVKLALDMYYLEHWNLLYDIEIVFRTIYVIVVSLLGKKKFTYPKEFKKVFGK